LHVVRRWVVTVGVIPHLNTKIKTHYRSGRRECEAKLWVLGKAEWLAVKQDIYGSDGKGEVQARAVGASAC
jgi:hypothetical protein